MLRVSDPTQYATKLAEFNKMKQVAALGSPMCRPIAFGVCEEGGYSIQSQIDGTDTETLLPTLPDRRQYEYSLEAGRILSYIACASSARNGRSKSRSVRMDRVPL